jgi:hypothetical protein
MASKKKMKHYPVLRECMLTQPLPAGNRVLADVPKLLSQMNHRLYRQSRVYEVSISVDADLPDNTSLDVYALADTWMVHNALQMAKDAFDESNAEEKEMLNGKVARWNDFRVKTGVSGTGTYQATTFLKGTLAATPYTAGEFVNSKVVDQAGATRLFTWGPGTASDYSIIEEYDAAGNTSWDPTYPATGPYNGLLPNLEAGAASALQGDGNQPPYDAQDIGQNIWVKVGTLHLGPGRQRLSTGFFKAPCGMVIIDGAAVSEYNGNLSIEVKGGDYKGVKAPSMLE